MDKGKKINLLLVDDEPDIGNTVKAGLEIGGLFSVTVAVNGKQGIDLAKRLKPEMILLDISMPMMDGFKVLEILKKDKHTMLIPVVMFSVKDDDASKIKAAQLYDEEYITKTSDIFALKAKIEEILKRKAIIK